MNVLVIGCGLLGRKIARTMDEMGWDVSVLSNIESDLELLENDFEGVTFRGFPMDIRNLREAGIESCDAVAVTTADDNLNMPVVDINTLKSVNALNLLNHIVLNGGNAFNL